jgi:hypothetical protein
MCKNRHIKIHYKMAAETRNDSGDSPQIRLLTLRLMSFGFCRSAHGQEISRELSNYLELSY